MLSCKWKEAHILEFCLKVREWTSIIAYARTLAARPEHLQSLKIRNNTEGSRVGTKRVYQEGENVQSVNLTTSQHREGEKDLFINDLM